MAVTTPNGQFFSSSTALVQCELRHSEQISSGHSAGFQLRWITAEFLNRPLPSSRSFYPPAARSFSIQLAGQCAAAEISGLITGALFIGKGDDLDCERQRLVSSAGFAPRTLWPANAEWPVKFARVSHRIQSEPSSRIFESVFGPGKWPDQIAQGIYFRAHARVPHPGLDEVIGTAHCGRGEEARQLARLIADAAQRFDALRDDGFSFHDTCCYDHGEQSSGT